MSKAILVMDMPESCARCRLYWGYCQYNRRKLLDSSKKSQFCPLKPIPEKMVEENRWFSKEYVEGWNACIDEILKEGER